MDCVDLQKIEYPELHKFYGKLGTSYVQILWIYRKIEYPYLRKSDGKFYAIDVRIAGFAD